MHALAEAGWDIVLNGIARHHGLKSLSNYYASFIALTHAQYSSMHADSEHA